MLAKGRRLSDADGRRYRIVPRRRCSVRTRRSPHRPKRCRNTSRWCGRSARARMNIVYVEYDFAALNGMGPWSAVEDKDGKFWIPYYGRGNGVVRLDAKTGEQTRSRCRFRRCAAGIHSVIPAPDGTVWFTEARGWPDRAARTRRPGDHRISEHAAARRQAHHRAHGSGRRRADASGRAAVRRSRCSIPNDERFTHFDLGGTYGNVVGAERRPVVHLVRRRRTDRAGHQGRRADEVLSADQGQAAAPPGRRATARLVHRAPRRQDRPFRSQDREFKEFPLPGPRSRAPTRSGSIATTWSGTRRTSRTR